MADSIEQLSREIEALWEEAGYATSGAEGLAAMGGVRRAQARLAAALLEAAAASEAARDVAGAASLQGRARATLLEVLTSAHGPAHEGCLPMLETLLARLGAPAGADLRAVAAAWLDSAERSAAQGCPREARALARRVLALFNARPGFDELLARARAI